VFSYAFLIGGSFLMLVPFFWMLSSSLKPMNAIFLFPPRWLPNPPQWSNYSQAMTVLPFYRYFINTFRIEVGVIAGWTITSALPAYSFARLRWPGRDIVFYLLLGVLMLPGFVVLVPTFILWSHLHGVNSYWPLILPTWFRQPIFHLPLAPVFPDDPPGVGGRGAHRWRRLPAYLLGDQRALGQAGPGRRRDFLLYARLERVPDAAHLPQQSREVHHRPWPGLLHQSPTARAGTS